MFLAVVYEGNLGLEIFASLGVSKFAYMAASLASFTSVPGLDDLTAGTESAKATFPWDKSRIFVGQQFADESCARIGIFVFFGLADGVEGLGIVTAH